MCREMMVIPVDRVVDTKRIIGRRKVCGGGEAQGVPDLKTLHPSKNLARV
jgi:hypothetical protein